ncbi:MAG: hypothetical protein ACOCTI_02600 [Phycisphaeraceae bacterium]
MRRTRCAAALTLICMAAGLFAAPRPAAAGVDVETTYTGALHQPQIVAMVRRGPDGEVLSGSDPLFGGSTIAIEAYYDTGATGVIVAPLQGGDFGIQSVADRWFLDFGVSGEAYQFEVGEELTFQLAPYRDEAWSFYQDPANYTQTFEGIRPVIGPADPDATDPQDPLDPWNIIEQMSQVNVFGTPLMQGREVVMDARQLNRYVRTGDLTSGLPIIRTSVVDAGSSAALPRTDYTVRTTLADFARFTRTVDRDAAGSETPVPANEQPSLARNPFIGPDPLATTENDVPGITISRGGESSSGSWLFDTGAAASIISQQQAGNLGVRYKPGFEPRTPESATDGYTPRLQVQVGENWEDLELTEQFELSIQGIGGTVRIAGFWLDLLELPVLDALGHEDVIRYHDAPVLVYDVGVSNPDPDVDETVVLDGVLGMNLMFATMFVDEPFDPLSIGALPTAEGPYDFVRFDATTGEIALTLVPEPGTLVLALAGGLLVLGPRRLMRRR